MKQTSLYILGYTGVSVALFAWALYDSLGKSTEVFTLVVEITNGYKLGILINLILTSFMGGMAALMFLIFGGLRIIEVEHLVERLPLYAVNLLFNLASNDNLIFTSLLLGLSVASKAYHIILCDRYDHVQMRLTNNAAEWSRQQVARAYTLDLFFWMLPATILVDFSVAKILVYDVFKGINSVTCLLFGFQFAVQGVEILAYYLKVLLNFYELVVFRGEADEEADEEGNEVADRAAAAEGAAAEGAALEVEGEEAAAVNEEAGAAAPGDDAPDTAGGENEIDFDDDDDDDEGTVWENKGFYVKAVDLVSTAFKALSYLSFIYLLTIASNLSLPISMLQGTYSSVVQTYKEFISFRQFIEASQKLSTMLPNATTDELESSDRLCIICRDNMHSLEEYEALASEAPRKRKPFSTRRHPKKLPCSHIIHMGCLKDWLERSDHCPLCRRKVFMTPDELARENMRREEQEQINRRLDAINGERNNNQRAPGLGDVFAAAEAEFANLPAGMRPAVTPRDAAADSSDQQQRRLNEEFKREHLNGHITDVIGVDSSMRKQTRSPMGETSANQSSSTGSAATTTTNGTEYQTLRLPKTVHIPPNWTPIPLERDQVDPSGYKVKLSKTSIGNFRIVRKTEAEDLQLFKRGEQLDEHTQG